MTQAKKATAGARTGPRATYHHGDLPAALRSAALRLIAERGVEGFSLREAAQAVGVAPSAAYRHFADRSALLSAIAVDGFLELVQWFAAATAQVPVAARSPRARVARQRFVALGRAYVEFALAQPERFAVMFGPHGSGNPQVRDAVLQRSRGARVALTDALDELLAAGVMAPSKRPHAELTAWSAVHGLAALLASGSLQTGHLTASAMADRVCQDLLDALI